MSRKFRIDVKEIMDDLEDVLVSQYVIESYEDLEDVGDHKLVHSIEEYAGAAVLPLSQGERDE